MSPALYSSLLKEQLNHILSALQIKLPFKVIDYFCTRPILLFILIISLKLSMKRKWKQNLGPLDSYLGIE